LTRGPNPDRLRRAIRCHLATTIHGAGAPHDDLASLVTAGLTPYQALRGAP
jgi:hypothetical protein